MCEARPAAGETRQRRTGAFAVNSTKFRGTQSAITHPFVTELDKVGTVHQASYHGIPTCADNPCVFLIRSWDDQKSSPTHGFTPPLKAHKKASGLDARGP